MAETYRLTPLRKLGNLIMRTTSRLGLNKSTHVLTVRGRKTGKQYSTPVRLVEQNGERWLVAPYGERSWVRNARAAGAVELSQARKTERARVIEVPAQERAPILREYLRRVPETKAYFDATAESPLDAFAAEASRHPVFKLERTI